MSGSTPKYPHCHKKSKTSCSKNKSCIYVNKTRKYCRIGNGGLCSRRTTNNCLSKKGCGLYTRLNKTRCRRVPPK